MKINIEGSKNSILPLLSASCLINGIMTFHNSPQIKDIDIMLDIISKLNIEYIQKNDKIILNSKNIILNSNLIIPNNSIRSSYYFFSTLAHFKTKILHSPINGCKIGDRNIEEHINFFNKMGVKINFLGQGIEVDSINFKNDYSLIHSFKKISVGATINAIYLSVIGKGVIKLNNCSIDPYILEVINVLNNLGARIQIIERDIIIERVAILNSETNYTLEGDPIVSGTYILFNALMQKNTILEGLSNNLGEFKNILEKVGIEINNIKPILEYKEFYTETNPYPGLYTDLMPFLVILGSQIGNSFITENIYSSIFKYAEELKKINLNFQILDNTIRIHKSHFYFEGDTIDLNCPDLRGGMAILLASCICLKNYPNKKIFLHNISYIERGYTNIVNNMSLYNIKMIKYYNSYILSFISSENPINLTSG